MEMIKIIIDGKEIVAPKGQTVLQIACANGIDIPNLCYTDELKPYGACGLCTVEAENVPKLLRACATVATDGMVIKTKSPRLRTGADSYRENDRPLSVGRGRFPQNISNIFSCSDREKRQRFAISVSIFVSSAPNPDAPFLMSELLAGYPL